MSLNIQQIRADFPILNEKIRGKQLVYLDNGASTQKPQMARILLRVVCVSVGSTPL